MCTAAAAPEAGRCPSLADSVTSMKPAGETNAAGRVLELIPRPISAGHCARGEAAIDVGDFQVRVAHDVGGGLYVQAQLALVGRDDDLVTLVYAHGAGDVAQPEGNCDESLDVTRGVREPVLGDGDRQRWSHRGARGRRRSGGDPAALLRAEPLLFAPRLDAGRLRHLPLAPAGDPRREPPAQGDHLRRFSVGGER